MSAKNTMRLRVKVEKSVRLVDGLVTTEVSAPDETIVIKRLPDSVQRPYGKCRYISVDNIGSSLQQMNQTMVQMSTNIWTKNPKKRVTNR